MSFRREIDDGKSAERESQTRSAVVKHAGIVRSSMQERAAHPVEELNRVLIERLCGPKSCNSAHESLVPGPLFAVSRSL